MWKQKIVVAHQHVNCHSTIFFPASGATFSGAVLVSPGSRLQKHLGRRDRRPGAGPRCHIEDDVEGGTVIHIDDVELDLAGFGMRTLVTGYEPLIGTLELPDTDDRHVLAAAIRCGAQYIVTDNLADFPADVLSQFDIEAIDADGFLSRTFDLYPSDALGVLRTLRKAYSNPPFTPPEFVRDLTAKGSPAGCPDRGAPGRARGKSAAPPVIVLSPLFHTLSGTGCLPGCHRGRISRPRVTCARAEPTAASAPSEKQLSPIALRSLPRVG